MEDHKDSDKKDPSNVQNSPQSLNICNHTLHGNNDQDSPISRVTLSSRPQSRRKSISSCQTDPNPVTTIQEGASNQGLQNLVVNQENLALKHEIAELRDQISTSKLRIDELHKFCSCIIPYIGAQWSDFRQFVQKYGQSNQKNNTYDVDDIVLNPNNLIQRHNQLEHDVLVLKNRMENQVDVNKTATSCDFPSASQRFIHQQTPMNLNKGMPPQNLGKFKPGQMDIEHDPNPYPL